MGDGGALWAVHFYRSNAGVVDKFSRLRYQDYELILEEAAIATNEKWIA